MSTFVPSIAPHSHDHQSNLDSDTDQEKKVDERCEMSLDSGEMTCSLLFHVRSFEDRIRSE